MTILEFSQLQKCSLTFQSLIIAEKEQFFKSGGTCFQACLSSVRGEEGEEGMTRVLDYITKFPEAALSVNGVIGRRLVCMMDRDASTTLQCFVISGRAVIMQDCILLGYDAFVEFVKTA